MFYLCTGTVTISSREPSYPSNFLFKKHKNAFQWDAYRPLVDRILQYLRGGGGVCPGGVYQGVSAGGVGGVCPGGVCLGGWQTPPWPEADTPLVDRQTLWKHNLRKLRLRAVKWWTTNVSVTVTLWWFCPRVRSRNSGKSLPCYIIRNQPCRKSVIALQLIPLSHWNFSLNPAQRNGIWLNLLVVVDEMKKQKLYKNSCTEDFRVFTCWRHHHALY